MKSILIIDIETTGFQDQGGKIVEVGIARLDLDSGIIDLLYQSVRKEPEMSIEEIKNSWIVKNSTLGVSEVINAPLFSAYNIQIAINAFPLGATAYNRDFDFNFLESRGITFPKMLPCAMLVATDVCKLPFKGVERITPLKYKWPSMEECYRMLFNEPDYTEQHRAGQDAIDEARIVYELYKMGVYKID